MGDGKEEKEEEDRRNAGNFPNLYYDFLLPIILGGCSAGVWFFSEFE